MNYIRIECPYHLLDALGAIHLVMKVNKICGEFSPFSTGGKKFKNDIFEVNGYIECYCKPNECKCATYNFKWKDIEVSWYKHLHRSTYVNKEVSEEETKTLLSECLKSIL